MQSSHVQNTIKLVAMSLIASDRLFEAVELLVLIDNGMDACRCVGGVVMLVC